MPNSIINFTVIIIKDVHRNRKPVAWNPSEMSEHGQSCKQTFSDCQCMYLHTIHIV